MHRSKRAGAGEQGKESARGGRGGGGGTKAGKAGCRRQNRWLLVAAYSPGAATRWLISGGHRDGRPERLSVHQHCPR
jgi:hypothetical protein